MLMTMRRVLSFPLSNTLSGGGGGGSDGDRDGMSNAFKEQPKHKGKLPIEQIKKRMELVLHDVNGVQADRLLHKIRTCRNVNELWMLRSNMYQMVAMLHSQSEAARRINSLLPCFSQWIAARQLGTI